MTTDLKQIIVNMNENIDLVKILKNCPKGTKLYSPLFGDVFLLGVKEGYDYPIIIEVRLGEKGISISFKGYDLEYLLFPAKDRRDWNKFECPKSKFDPKTLQPFDKVLIRYKQSGIWFNDFYSFISKDGIIAIGNEHFDSVIPYNDDTKHLVGTSDEAPEYYRYWKE